MQQLQHEIRQVSADEVFPVRHSVLRPQREPEASRYPLDNAEGSFHLGLYDAAQLIGVSTFHPAAHPDFADAAQYQLRGMAVLPEQQGRGLGQALMMRGFELLRDRSCTLLWCRARGVAVPFYQRMGLSTYGEWFESPHSGPGILMYRRF